MTHLGVPKELRDSREGAEKSADRGRRGRPSDAYCSVRQAEAPQCVAVVRPELSAGAAKRRGSQKAVVTPDHRPQPQFVLGFGEKGGTVALQHFEMLGR